MCLRLRAGLFKQVHPKKLQVMVWGNSRTWTAEKRWEVLKAVANSRRERKNRKAGRDVVQTEKEIYMERQNWASFLIKVLLGATVL